MLDNISIDLCQSILNKASDSSLHEESHDFDDVFDAGDILSSLSNKINEVVLSKELIIKSSAACIWTLKSSSNIDDCILALTIYHQLMRSAVFGSLGCRSLGIRKFVFLSFCKIAMKTLKGVDCSGPTTVSDAVDEDFAIEVVNEPSQRPRRQASQSSQSKSTTKRSKSSLSNKKGLSIFAKLLEESLCTLLENTDEDFVSIVSESLVFLLEMSIFTDDWKNSGQPIGSLFKAFVKLASETALSLHQCIMPGLSYCFDRSSIYSDSAGIRAAVHTALVEIYAPMTAELLSSPFKSIIPRARNSLPGNVSFDTSSMSSRATTPAKSVRGTPATTPGSAKSVRSAASGAMDVDEEQPSHPSSKEFSTGQECLLSALQRMTLLCPDRANIRQVVAKSISLIINAIVHDTNRTVANKVLGHYVQFLTRLARSQRAQHRSFALEIICIMIQEENIWSSGVDHLELFQVLIARSLDQSPVVRLKALSTIYDFMENAEDSNRLHMLHELVMGTARGSNGASLLDAARTATTETKPMLRAKALQVLTCILTKEWIRPTAVTELAKANDEADYFRLTLMDDDLQAIVAAFSDPSIAVRKQAVHCLTEVLKAHPSSPSALSTWVMTALPLIIDTEATVVQKVASVFEDVVLSALHEDVTTDDLSLGWKALYKIGECNMIQILKHIVGYMIRQGGITFERSGQSSFFRLVNMCKVHCEAGLSSSVVHADISAVDVEESLNATTRTMAATEAQAGAVPLEQIYYEASWILLEAFASHCGLKVNNARGQLISVEEQFQKVGSAKFVYDAFRAHCQHTEVAAMSMHQEDNFLRILKVLDKFLSTLTEDELAFVSQEIKTRLMSLSLQAPVAALMISIQYQIAKVQSEQTATTATTATAGNRTKMMLATRVTAWVTPLLEKIFQQLKSFAFGAHPNASGNNVTMSNLSQLSQPQDSSTLSSLPSMRIVQIGLFIIGELSMLGFQLDEAPLKMLMKSGGGADGENDQSVPLVTITQDVTGAVRVRFATRLSEMLQLFMAKTLPGADGHGALRCPQPVRAVAFITVGKLCMRDHVLARDALNVFLRELTCEDDTLNANSEVSMSALTEQSFITQSTMGTKNSVRNNALLVLADLCVRHTHLVDRHIDTLACCLQDRDVMIRRNALMLISQLLMQDFVKLKGLLLYRFLMLTVDDDEELAVFAKEVIERSLCVKYSGILVNHFSEALIILNKCSEHPIYSAVAFAVGQDNGHPAGSTGGGAIDDHVFSQAFAMDTSAIELDPNTKAFHASNDLTRAQRFHIFNFMAANINDETKIQITAKLVNDILASAVDHSQRLLPDRNNIAISSSAMKKYGNNQRDSFGGITPSAKTLVDFTRFETAIEDVFIFLRSPVLKIGAKKKQGAEQEDAVLMDDAAEQAAATTAGQIAQAKTKILKALSSQHMVSHVLPVVVSLKHVLEQLKSPLQGALMEYLLYLVKHHASEVDQALQYDPTLKAEIEFDLRQFERQRKEQAQLQQQQQQARLNGGPMSAIKRTSNMPTPHLDRIVASMTSSSSSVTNSAIRPSTVQKPVLLKSASKLSVTSSERKVPGSVRFHDSVRGSSSSSSHDDEDPMLRVMSQPDEIAPEEFIANISSHHDTTNLSGISHRLSSSSSGRDLSNLSLLSDSDVLVLGESSSSISRGNSAQKRRSWGVVLPTFGSRISSSDETDENRTRGNEQLSASGRGDDDDETPARKRSRTHSRSNSLGGGRDSSDAAASATMTHSAQSVKSSRLSSSSTSSSTSSKKVNQQPVFLMMKKDATTAPVAVVGGASTKLLANVDESLLNDSMTTVPKKLDFMFADLETPQTGEEVAAAQPLMPPPAPIMGGKRSAKVATSTLMMAMR